jgi:hypothetical protein
MPVSSNDVDQMANLMAIMNGTPAPRRQQQDSVNGQPIEGGIINPKPDDGANVDAMKRVLENFYGVNKGMEKVAMTLIDESQFDGDLRTALVTEETDDGSRIGEWEIYLKEEGKRKFYDVVNDHTGVTIAADLTLYEAAFGIARSLADGLPITSRVVRDILIAEGDYAQALNDAIIHKHTLSKKLPETRRMVLEDRYDVAKQKARTARQRVEDLVKPPF